VNGPRPGPTGAALALALALALATALAACDEQRVEYRYRPAYMTDANSPSETVLADGTKVVFLDRDPAPSMLDRDLGGTLQKAKQRKLGPDGKPIPEKVFEPRETLEDGTVVLRNIMPDHVVANTMACLKNEEYRLMWDQLLAPDTKAAYQKKGGYPAFEKWCVESRRPAMELLNRMRFNAMGADVTMTKVSANRMRAVVSPHLWDQFKLRVVEFEMTPDGMKLASIRPSP
jgi:hypothetical protein